VHVPSLGEFLVIGFVAIVLLGPDKLPEAAKQLGAFWRSIKEYQDKVEATFKEQLPNLPSTTEMARMARSPVTLLNKLADFDVTGEAVVADPGATAKRYDDHFPEDSGIGTPEPGSTASTPTPGPQVLPQDPSLN
jgi:Sec-independent protein translocase protein TatA